MAHVHDYANVCDMWHVRRGSETIWSSYIHSRLESLSAARTKLDTATVVTYQLRTTILRTFISEFRVNLVSQRAERNQLEVSHCRTRCLMLLFYP
jgi:hypothetical protein